MDERMTKEAGVEMAIFSEAMEKALHAMMGVVKSAQQGTTQGIDQKNSGKPDGTNVTITDYASEAAALIHLEGLPVFAEERGIVGNPHPQYEILIDPLDGTRPFLNGAPTSTCINALYDKVKKEVIGCMVGEPVSGRVWKYMPGMESSMVYYLGEFFTGPTSIHVFDGEMGVKTTVYADFYPTFTKKGSHSLSDEEQAKLFGRLFGKVSAISMFGSNAIHHALVAGGRKKDVVGAITACLGGPWDVAPVILVAKAGGCVRGFTRIEGAWEEQPAMDIKAHHFTISGNTPETVGKLVDVLTSI